MYPKEITFKLATAGGIGYGCREESSTEEKGYKKVLIKIKEVGGYLRMTITKAMGRGSGER